MDKLPCSTSFLMSINFDGLKDVINFFHKNLNIMNEKINDISKRFKGFEDIQNELNENKIKTESGLRLIGDLEQSINNHSQNIIENSNRIFTNKDNLEQLKLEIEKIKIDNINISNKIENLISNSNNEDKNNNEKSSDEINNAKELENEINKMKIENKNNFDMILKKIEDLESKTKQTYEKESEKSDIIKNKVDIIKNEKINDDNNKDIEEKEKDIRKQEEKINNEEKEEDNNNEEKEEEDNNEEIKENKFNILENNKLLKDLSERLNQLEENIKKISNEEVKNIIPPNSNQITEIKEIKSSNAENNLEEEKPVKNFENKLNEIENKISKLENDFFSLQLNKNINDDMNHNLIVQNQISDEIINNNTIQKENNEGLNPKQENNNNAIEQIKNIISNEHKNYNSLQNKIYEIISQINELNNKISANKFLGKNEFNKYSQKLDIQLKDYNDKINDILLKISLNSENVKRLSLVNDIPKNFEKNEYETVNNNRKDLILLEKIESNTRKLIMDFLKKLDISGNPQILKIEKELEKTNSSIDELSNKLTELSQDGIKNLKKEFLKLNEITEKNIENDIKNIDDKIKDINLLKEEINFLQGILFGNEEMEKYKKMTKAERKNEISMGNSIKEEIKIHSDYLKKLSEGINKVNNRLSNLNKENLAAIKRDLKNESNFILADFKLGLKDSINNIETKLKDKVDKLGLDQFWSKINEQLIEEMNQKIDKKEMNKNNMYLKKKIDNLESKISRTLVDTLIDLQMDEAPLLVKKNFREITEQKCASCGQNLQNVANNGLLGYSLDFNNMGTNQHKTFKQKNIADKDKLPEIKTNSQK